MFTIFMSPKNLLTIALFRTNNNGEIVYYPYGILSRKTYIVSKQEKENIIRKTLHLNGMVLAIILIVVVLNHYYKPLGPFLNAGIFFLVIFFMSYMTHFYVKKDVKSPPLKNHSITEYLKNMNQMQVWVGFIGSLTVLLGLLYLLYDTISLRTTLSAVCLTFFAGILTSLYGICLYHKYRK